MKLQNEFTVPAPRRAGLRGAARRRARRPVPARAPSLDGGDGETFTGAMTIKLGPVTSRYKGTVRITRPTRAAHRAVLRAEAQRRARPGTAAATITTVDAPRSPTARAWRSRPTCGSAGPAAQFGRGVMQDVSGKLMRQFADCLAEEMQADGAVGAGPGRRRRPDRRHAARRGAGRTAPTAVLELQETRRRPAPVGPAADAALAAAATSGAARRGRRAPRGRGPRPGRRLARRRPQAASCPPRAAALAAVTADRRLEEEHS